jgi:hypothetical protein
MRGRIATPSTKCAQRIDTAECGLSILIAQLRQSRWSARRETGGLRHFKGAPIPGAAPRLSAGSANGLCGANWEGGNRDERTYAVVTK